MKKINAVTGGKIYTFKEEGHYTDSMLIKNGIIQKIDCDEAVYTEDIEKGAVYYLNNFVVVPGFIDSHLHVLSLGKKIDQVNLQGVQSIDELKQRVAEKVNQSKEGQWVLGYGWDQDDFIEQRYPSRHDLDEISDKHPIVLWRNCHHILVANTLALSLAGITKQSNDPIGGRIDRDEQGEPTGILRENAMVLLTEKIPPSTLEQKKIWLKKAMAYLNSIGITSVQTNDKASFQAYKDLKSELTLRVTLTPLYEELEDYTGSKTGDGDDWLRLGRLKVYSDGSLGAETAALLEPYENSDSKGMLIYSNEDLDEIMKRIKEHGWQPETHAIGDAAALQVVQSYIKHFTPEDRPILTHCQILNPTIIQLMAKHGIIANIQPIFINNDMKWAEKRVGKHRMQWSYAWKTLIEAGVHCSGGSDAPIEPPNPLLGIHAAVNRQNLRGEPPQGWYPEQKLTVWEAFNLFTTKAAYTEFNEHKKGKLLPGYLADFIVLDKDPFETPPEKLSTINVIATIVGGNLVFQRNSK